MKYTYAVNDKLTVEFEAANTKELVENLANVDSVTKFGKCSHCNNSTDFSYIVRNVGADDKYYEVKCDKCFWVLGFGIPKKREPNLYPRRVNNKTKEPIGPKADGWHKFNKELNQDEEE